jgi:hypothetical protein
VNAVERLEAAITKLEGLRGSKPESGDREWTQRGRTIFAFDGTPVAKDVLSWDRDLIVTLHRTIDAQLAILRHVRAHYSGDLGISTNRHVVALADAILGGDQ